MILCNHYEEFKKMKERNSIVFQIESIKSNIERMMIDHIENCVEHNKKYLDKSV